MCLKDKKVVYFEYLGIVYKKIICNAVDFSFVSIDKEDVLGPKLLQNALDYQFYEVTILHELLHVLCILLKLIII